MKLRTRASILTTKDPAQLRARLRTVPLVLAFAAMGCTSTDALDEPVLPVAADMNTATTDETTAPTRPSTETPTAGEERGADLPADQDPIPDAPPLDDPERPADPGNPDVGLPDGPIDEEPASDPPAAESVPCGDFQTEILPVIETACGACHNSGLALGGLDLSAASAYTALTTGTSVTGSPFVVPGQPDASYLIAKLGPTPPQGVTMPPPPDSLSDAEITAMRDWILAGAPNGEYGVCESDTPETDAPSTHDVDFQVTYTGGASGNLLIALFDTYPPVAPPVAVAQIDGAVFPTTVELTNVPAGAYIAEVVLDVMPFNFGSVGAGDLVEKAAMTVPTNGPVAVTLVGSASDSAPDIDDALCGECAPGLACGANPNSPENACTGDAGTCGDVTFAGTCVSDTVVLYCSSDEGDGVPVSIDCSLTPETPLCGEVVPGSFDCMAMVDPQEPTEPVSPEEPVDPEEPAEPVDPEEPSDPADTDPISPDPIADGPCGACAPGLSCGQDPSLPENFCSGAAGECEGLDYAGTCLSGGVLTYCSTDDVGGVPISIDCSLNDELSSCGETSPGYFDCTAPTDAPPAPPEVPEEPEDVVDAAYALFTQAHPILEASCSGWLCHQYSGFAQPDLDAAYAVVLEKTFADNILDAIVEGRMPAGNFGQPLCTGDPSVDTDPMCLTQDELDIVTAWVNAEMGVLPEEPAADEPTDAPVDDAPIDDEPIDDEPIDDAPIDEEPAAEPVSFFQVHAVLEAGCGGFFCHSGGFANQSIDVAYDTVVSKDLCESILDVVQSGAMPPGKGCTGDPVQDSNIPGCLDADEHALLEAWVTGSDEPCPGPE